MSPKRGKRNSTASLNYGKTRRSKLSSENVETTSVSNAESHNETKEIENMIRDVLREIVSSIGEKKRKKTLRPAKKSGSTICAKDSTNQQNTSAMPVIQSVSSLASVERNHTNKNKTTENSKVLLNSKGDEKKHERSHIQVQTMIDAVKETRLRIPKPTEMRNKAVMTRPILMTKSVNCHPSNCPKQMQTEDDEDPAIVPLGVPCYLPIPLPMYQKMYPVLVPVPLPIPVPILIPTSPGSYESINKKIQKIRVRVPDNALEAEMLRLAGDDVFDEIDSEEVEQYSKKLRLDEMPLDMEKDVPLKVAEAKARPAEDTNNNVSSEWELKKKSAIQKENARKKEQQKKDQEIIVQKSKASHLPTDKLDSKHHLKFTYGVKAWSHWVQQKNRSIGCAKDQGEFAKYFETDILKLRADELNYMLCMFVKEVRKPNGELYAADSILYLTYGIQVYLFENGRLDSIFIDPYYDAFTTAIHDAVKDFQLPRNELGFYVTRIEEEHLWESRQLGAHSPQALLNTLVYFNTKFFMLRTASDHSKLSFHQLIKQWKNGYNQNDGQKSIILSYRPLTKKGPRMEDKYLDMQENLQDPLRCPVKLYEFYLSKCPLGSKCQNNGFYLMPENSCQPNSPVWYGNTFLSEKSIDKMLQRSLMVREVQEQLLIIQTSGKLGCNRS